MCIACVQSVKEGKSVDQLLDAKLMFKEVEGCSQFHLSCCGVIRLGKKRKTACLDFRGAKLYLYEFFLVRSLRLALYPFFFPRRMFPCQLN